MTNVKVARNDTVTRIITVMLVTVLFMEAQMPTVFEVLLHAARNLDGLIEGTATADGSVTTLIDSHLNAVQAGRQDNDFNGGSLFVQTNQRTATAFVEVTGEALGQVSTSREFHSRLLETPIKPGSVTVTVGSGGSVTDDGRGGLSYLSEAAETNISMASGAGPWAMQSGNLVPGSLRVKETGAGPDTLYYDDGGGYLRDALTGTAWATINYDTGTVTLISGQPDLAALSLASYTYYTWYGTINYETGEVYLRFAQALSVAVTADYEHGYAAFLPLIVTVADFEAATGTVTFEAGALNLETTKGDAYGVMPRRYPRWLLFQKLNECLREITDYVSTSTTLASAMVNDQVGCPATARVLRVLAGNADTTDRAWRVVSRYTRHDEVIRLLDGVPADADLIMVETLGTPAQVTSESASISEWYSAEWLGLETAARCMRWRLQQPGADAQLVTTLLNDLLRRAQNAKGRLTAWRSVSVKWPEYPEN